MISPNRVIVSRHPAAIEFIAKALRGTYSPKEVVYINPLGATFVGPAVILRDEEEPVTVPVEAFATPDKVRGKVVYGNVPLHLAALAVMVAAVEFTGEPPRGQEYSLEDMEAAGARLAYYRVKGLTDGRPYKDDYK